MTLRSVATQIGVAFLVLTLGAFLFVDATTFALHAPNPAAGRAGGCYTAIEDLLGVSHPTWIRDAELVASAVLLVAVPATGLRAFLRRRRAIQHRVSEQRER